MYFITGITLRSNHRRIEGMRNLSQGRKKSPHEYYQGPCCGLWGFILSASPKKLLERP